MLDNVGPDNTRATPSLQELLDDLRSRSKDREPGELDALIEKAREQFYRLLNPSKTPADADL